MSVRSTSSRAARPARRRPVGRLALLPFAALATTGAVTVAVPGTGTLPASAALSRTKTTTVTATETDFHIALSKKTFTPGRYTFVAKNKGVTTHGIQITGPGLSNATSQLISPGQSTKLTVTLKKGTYDFFCPVPGHKQLGMNVILHVGGS